MKKTHTKGWDIAANNHKTLKLPYSVTKFNTLTLSIIDKYHNQTGRQQVPHHSWYYFQDYSRDVEACKQLRSVRSRVLFNPIINQLIYKHFNQGNIWNQHSLFNIEAIFFYSVPLQKHRTFVLVFAELDYTVNAVSMINFYKYHEK